MTGLERLRNVANAMRGYTVHGGGPLDLELMGIADRIERETAHDHSKEVSMSAYDLLPEEDRKAIAWVREKGGVNALSMGFQDADNRRIELCSSLGIDLATGWADAMAAMRRRLMPEGMEWPRYESGEPVKPGSWLQDNDGEAFEAVSFVFTCDWWGIHGYRPDRYGTIGTKYRRQLDGMAYGTHVKRPAVLAADGEPLEVGQTVWHVATGHEYTVRSCTNGGAHLSRDGKPAGYCRADYLTHQRPVLDADGVLCREGDEVWEVRSHRRREIVGTNYCDHRTGEPLILCDGDDAVPIPATCVTHTKPEPPDSWERIEEDKDLNPFEYCKEVGHKLDTCENAERFKANDIVRRCKRLAGVS